MQLELVTFSFKWEKYCVLDHKQSVALTLREWFILDTILREVEAIYINKTKRESSIKFTTPELVALPYLINKVRNTAAGTEK